MPADTSQIHGLYSHIKHATAYLLLQCFLDYSLHLPPDPLHLLTKTPDASTAQDIHPPFRFINLLFLFVFEFGRQKEEGKKRLTTERSYYSELLPLLAERVNEMHAAMRTPGTPATFFTMNQTTDMWKQNLTERHLQTFFLNVLESVIMPGCTANRSQIFGLLSIRSHLTWRWNFLEYF